MQERLRRASVMLQQAADKIYELEKNGPMMQRAVNDGGKIKMGTMREVLEDYKIAARAEACFADELRKELEQKYKDEAGESI